MQFRTKRLHLLAHALTAALVVGGIGAIVSPEPAIAAPSGATSIAETGGSTTKAIDEARALYIIGFVEAPLGRYHGEDAAFAAPGRETNGRIVDIEGTAAANYVAHLEAAQSSQVSAAAAQFGRALTPVMSFQHAFNGVVLSLSAGEAAYFRSQPRVEIVEAYAEYELDTDAGPSLIGAPGIWDGSSVPSGVATRGEGIVIGVIDSGINFDNPSFAGTEPGSAVLPGGYTHTNPLGAGNYLGSCAAGGADLGQCNSKLIGAYDFVYTVQCPNNTCIAGTSDEPSVEDSNGHGTHTASTSGGNAIDATFQGAVVPIAGVARHANLIAYDACYTRLSDNGGLCPNVSTLASVNRAVADGVVDVINYSIGGGVQPWSESVSLAFLTAHNAGIFVSASAGNSGPGASTLGHVEPWVASVGASTHTRKFGFDFDLTGPTAPPPNTQNIIVAPGGAPFASSSLINVPLIVSPGFNSLTNNDGCTAFPAGTFQRAGVGGIAAIRFLTSASACGSGTRRTNVLAAGAAGLLFVVDGPTGFAANNTTWQMDLPQWTPVAAHLATNPATATATITAPFAAYPVQQPDVMASFSSRGPSGFDLLKPDVTAPGVNILAAYSGNSASFNVISGTSMAAPHNAGAAALLRSLNPTWTPSEIKSALMTTAKTSAVFKEDAITPADPLDRGAGRIDLSAAAKAGLIFDESGANFTAANPATGGDPSTLNVASMQNDACVGTCSFTRTVRNARAGGVTYTLALSGPIAANATVTPANFIIGTSGTRQFTVAVNSLPLTAGAFTFGELSLTPSNPSIPTVRLPIAVRPSAPEIALSASGYTVSVAAGATTNRTLTISNLGNPTLNWALPNTPQVGTALAQASQGSNAIVSDLFNPTFNTGAYSADDFTLFAPGEVRRLVAPGSTSGGANLATLATAITWRIYADAAGVPASVPETGAPPLFVATRAPTAPGVSVAGSVISLDLVAAGIVPPALAPGRYWVMVSPTVPGTAANHTTITRWNWFASTQPSGASAQIVTPGAAFGGFTGGVYAPIAAAVNPAFEGLALTVDAQVGCGAPWLMPSASSGSLAIGGSSAVNLTFDATALAAGTYDAYLCVSSEGTDADEPMTLLPVRLNVLAGPSNPSGVGASNPTTVGQGLATLLTVAVTPGENPTSTALTVAVDLTTIGGGAAQAFLDNGTGGDATAGDNVFSFNATVAPATTTGAKSLPVTIGDAQARTGNTSIGLTVAAPTPPTATGRAAPTSVTPGTIVLLTATATPGAFPTSTGFAVNGDLTSIGGSATQVFLDDGLLGDITAGDSVFSYRTSVALATAPGAKSMPLAVIDAQGRTPAVAPTIALTVFAGAPLVSTGAAAPSSIAPSGNTLLTVTVTPGASPTSTGLRVLGNLSLIGGSASQLFYDDGTHGDVVSGNNVHSFRATVPLATTPGLKSLPATVSDLQGRAGAANVDVTVLTPTNPAGTGLATPASSYVGAATLLTVDVAPGTNPASTGVGVAVNLSSIGGSATQAFFDNATNGDLTAGDGRYSFSATVGVGTTPGNKLLTASISDAQARSGTTDIALTINAATSPSGTGAASPSTVARGGNTLLTVAVSPGTNPPSSGLIVVANLSSIGSGSAQALFDDGTNGDVTGGDGTWSFNASVAPDTVAGAKSLPVSITDAQARNAATTIGLTVSASTAPSGVGAATPATLQAGGATLLTVTVTPGTSPASTGVGVAANLVSIGGNVAQTFYDDGTNGDATAGDNVFSFATTVAVGTTLGAKSLPVSIVDAQLRTASGNIGLSVVGPSIFGSGFEG